tara:strand:- start:239 stop:529 length:291 start_codon:yes stop_codon:yes gene_type:complete
MKGGNKKPALDHCHTTGAVRDVLCLWCNGCEGKIFNLARTAFKDDPVLFLERLVEYHKRHQTDQHGLVHPTHKTEAQKKAARNLKARKKRAAAKKA